MASSRHLTDLDIEKILEIIDAWPLNRNFFGWVELRKAIQRKFQFSSVDRVWSSVQLAKYPSIKSAYDSMKAKQRAEKNSRHNEENLSPELRSAIRTIQMQENKIDRLETLVNRLYERFERWLYNARAKGLTEDELEMEIPVSERNQYVEKNKADLYPEKPVEEQSK